MAERLSWTRLTGMFKNKFGGLVGFLAADRKEFDDIPRLWKEVKNSDGTKQLMFSQRTFKEGENPVLSVTVAPIQPREETAPAADEFDSDVKF